MLDISPTVKKVVLRVDEPKFTFKSGQWVDFTISGVDIVGGFSICSTPKLLREQRLLELAVKKSKHPPVAWVHDKCRVGSTVQIQAGGEFFYDPRPSDPPKDLLLLAGGVGINPVRSIILHDKDLYDDHYAKSFGHCPGHATLLYCAKSPSELLFKDDFMRISDDINFQCVLFASQFKNVSDVGSKFTIHPGRITALDILSTVTAKKGGKSWLDIKRVMCYICGPREMVTSLVPALKECGISDEQIAYEAWTVTPPPSPASISKNAV
ncbi:oxidoreductase NAD-binding domain-containing protein 1-like isoform X2 [Paramacrobiotus metropolitanus]|nr:oxidoreductase NAD-binding domain-containing protein 1-like isoform X2 [Paramacrobiotus metropolitanus]